MIYTLRRIILSITFISSMTHHELTWHVPRGTAQAASITKT